MPGKEAPLNGNKVLMGKLILTDSVQTSALCGLSERISPIQPAMGNNR